MKTNGYFKQTVLLIFFIFITQMSNASTGSESAFNAAYQSAEASREKAVAIGNVWRDTQKYLKDAKKAAKAKKFYLAVKLANVARNQYETAIAQTESNKQYLKTAPFYDPNAFPEDDIKNIQAFFRDKFSKLPDTEFANGFYAMDPIMRTNWEAIEEFPPYIPAIEEGKVLWNTRFKNANSYKDCFNHAAISDQYPRWDRDAGEVETMPMAINACRKANGEKPFKYGKNKMLALQAYIAFESRGQLTSVTIPLDDPRALEAYQKGKKFYFSRRGQLNLACFHCHFYTAGKRIRANVLGPAMGQTTHWPAYRSKWGSMGSLHRRYKGCNKQVRAKPFDFQSEEYRNLEYFHTFISNGIPTNGPGTRF